MLMAQNDGHKIKIKVEGIKDTVCYLAGYFGKKQYYKDTSRFDSKGVCVFQGNQPMPGGIYSVILPNNNYFEFIINEQEFYLETDTNNLVENMKVKGSLENELFYSHFKLVASIQKEAATREKKLVTLKEQEKTDSVKVVRKRLGEINKELDNFKLKIIDEHPNTLLSKIFKGMRDPKVPAPPKDENGKVLDSLFQYKYYRKHYWDNIDFSNDNILRTPIYHNRLMQYMKKVIPQLPDSINAGLDDLLDKAQANDEIFKYTLGKAIYTFETSKIMGMDAVFVHLAEKYYMTNRAHWVDSVQLYKISERVRSIKPILIGKQAPPIYHVKDKNGQLIPLYSVDSEFLMLIFWDPDCGHCKKEMPKLKAIYDKYKNKGLQVYTVCTEVEKDKWLKYIEEKQYDWINVADFELRSPFRELYDISSTPKVFLLDKNKKIIAKHINHEQLDMILERKLK